MAEERVVTNALIRAAAVNATRPTSEERNFATLLQATRNNFRRNNSPETSGRGRKRKTSFKKKVVLMKLAHADFFPSNIELNFLKERGLGIATKDIEINRASPINEIKEELAGLYPPNIQHLLEMCGFKMGRVDKSRQIIAIDENISDGLDLEAKLQQSKLVILPNRDFPNDLPLIQNPQQCTRVREIQSTRDSGSSASTSQSPEYEIITPVASSTQSSRQLRPPIRLSLNHVSENELDTDDDSDVEEVVQNPVAQYSELIVEFPEVPDNAELQNIDVSRGNCLHELINIYQKEDILDKTINVRFVGEMGLDGGGLTKELFGIFFNKCQGVYFRGEDCLIPFLELHNFCQLDNFIIIGRIIRHMITLIKSLPSKLSSICLMLVADPDKQIKSETLFKELFLHVNPYLRKILKKAKNNFSSLKEKEIEVLQDFYQSNKFYARPSSDSFQNQLEIIARDILVDKPQKMIAKLREGISPEKFPNFWARCDFDVLSNLQSPTAEKVVNVLKTDPYLSNEETNVLHFFTMFIHCLDHDKLLTLIFLVTGSYSMPNVINLNFSDHVGLNQRPIFSTCTDTLTLPKTYSNYNELKNDLNACIGDESALEYTSY